MFQLQPQISKILELKSTKIYIMCFFRYIIVCSMCWPSIPFPKEIRDIQQIYSIYIPFKLPISIWKQPYANNLVELRNIPIKRSTRLGNHTSIKFTYLLWWMLKLPVKLWANNQWNNNNEGRRPLLFYFCLFFTYQKIFYFNILL